MRSLIGVPLVLSLGLVLHPGFGAAWLALLAVVGPAIYALVRRGAPRAYYGTLDDLLYEGERAIVAVSLVVMAFGVFMDVVWRTSHSMSGSTGWGFLVGLFVLAMMGAATARWEGGTVPKRVVAGLVGFAAMIGLGALIHAAPNGFGWSQRLALVLILWVGLLGGSMATKEGRHIAVDAVKRLLPTQLRRPFEVVAGSVTVALCVFLAVLGVLYARANYVEWVESEHTAAIFESLPIPYWTATLPIPIGFGLMAARFFGIVLYGAKEVDLLTSVGAAGAGEGKEAAR